MIGYWVAEYGTTREEQEADTPLLEQITFPERVSMQWGTVTVNGRPYRFERYDDRIPDIKLRIAEGQSR